MNSIILDDAVLLLNMKNTQKESAGICIVKNVDMNWITDMSIV